MTDVLARLSGIERRFGSITALAGASLELRSGEVHGVLGANGAGKSTLFHVLGGMQRPDAGTIEIDGHLVSFGSPRDAWGRGIALVHQHFTLVPALSVLENLALGLRRRSTESVRSEAEGVMERTGLRVPLESDVERLGVGDRQRTEILKALLREPRLLALDEPTAVLTPAEVDGLLDLLREIAAGGCAVALVAHKLDEVLGVADRVTVLRKGRTVLTTRPSELAPSGFVRAMVGEGAVDPIALGLTAGLGAERKASGAHADASGPVAEASGSAEEAMGDGAYTSETPREVASLRSVTVREDGRLLLDGVALSVAAGEIVGVAGVEGNGQRELALVLAGRLPPSEGETSIPDEVAYVPQDRSHGGLIPDFDITENVALALHRRVGFTRGEWMRWPAIRDAAEHVRGRFRVAAPSVTTRVGDLSGGNQQRVIVGRELALESPLLVAENPTRGLDVAASAFVHDQLRSLAASGIAIVLVSTDLDEVLALSDRVYVLSRGRLTAVPRGARSRDGVGKLMLSVRGEP